MVLLLVASQPKTNNMQGELNDHKSKHCFNSPPSVANNNGTKSVSIPLPRSQHREIDTEIIENQNARDQPYDLLDNSYYVDSNRYKIDHTTSDLEDSD